MKVKEFCDTLVSIATSYKTIYATGCFGWRMTEQNKQRALKSYKQNETKRHDLIMNSDKETFAFDCICLIKGVLWGWCGDMSHTYGGAKYCSNGVPDCTEDAMINSCKDVSTDFTNIVAGEMVYMKGHCGVYIGNGEVVEATSKWDCKVQITKLGNIKGCTGDKVRVWEKHGKLPYIEYPVAVTPPTVKRKTNKEIAIEVIKGLWGNGSVRKRKLTEAGYDAHEVQKLVNQILA